MKLKLSVFFTILIALLVWLIFVFFKDDIVEPVLTEPIQATVASKVTKASKKAEAVATQTVKTLDAETKAPPKNQSEIEQYPQTVLIYNADEPDEPPRELSREEYIQQLALAESAVEMGYDEKQKLEDEFFLISGQVDNDDRYYFDKEYVNAEDIEQLEMLRDTLASVMMQISFREKLLQSLTYRP